MSETVTNGVVRDRTLSRKGIILRCLTPALVLTICVGLLLPVSLRGQAAVGNDRAVIRPEALDALYSLDFEAAEAMFQELVDQNPENPRLWNLLASSIWLKIVFEQEKLNLDNYMGNRLGGSNGEVSSAVEQRLREVLGKAIALSNARLARQSDDLEALYAKGVAYGTLASFDATVKRKYFDAHRAAKTARETHLKLLQLDPSYNDARLTIGTYDYALGVIPGFLKILLGVIGIRGGDKEEGIRQLEYAAELGDRNGVNAKMVLVVVYNRERQYEKSLEILNDLHVRYPRNFLLETAKASVYERMQSWEEAVATYRSVLRKVRSGEDGYDRLDAEPLLFKIGEVNVRRSELDAALRIFQSLVPNPNADVAGRAHLWVGRIHDLRGERAEAIAAYDRVLLLDCSENLKDDAREARRRPYRV